MTTPTPASGPPSENGIPVFVDDSGRRLARARVAIRLVMGMLGGYVVLVAIGLAGSASLPAVHLADLGRLPTRSAASARLGAGSQQVALPVALQHAGASNGAASTAGKNPLSSHDANSRPGQNPGGARSPSAVPAPGTSVTPGSTNGPSATPTTTPTTQAGPATTTPTTVTPSTTTTVPAKGHGPPTSVPHGPPPAHGHKPS